MYYIVLKNLKEPDQFMHIGSYAIKDMAEHMRKQWRRALGGKQWTIDRRPGVDTIDHLALMVLSETELHWAEQSRDAKRGWLAELSL
jgi:hypothetical protein